ncbi:MULTISPECIES: hypothetical protein [Variovorax]|jgi:hypothetical protein|uniref:hypothetical protein n=1 Tax=Variovorax TaxID=34072 RepID=UPI0008AB4F7A|nr:hypothetical protein [Variovorax sp. OV084]SEU11461.1 hypothetical protein SAMN05443580_1162 [Variovorax sp. OV084]
MEKLSIIFKLRHVASVESFKGKGLIREAQDATVKDVEVFRIIAAKLRELKIPDRFTTASGLSDSRQVEAEIASTGKWSHTLKTESLAFRFGHVSSMEHSFVLIEELTNGAAATSWDDWVQPFLGFGEFVQAWISDVEYDFWQNASDPLQYQAAERTYSHLKLISNNLPPPLEQKIIDISKNPGRWSLRQGYVEAIGSTMWLGDAFWERVGEDRRNRVKASKSLNFSLLENGIVRLQAAKDCFNDEESKRLQEELRAILYE